MTSDNSQWDLLGRIDPVLAEGLTADRLYRRDADTWWHAGHHPLTDVTAPALKVGADAKRAWKEGYTIAFMGSCRDREVREGVTHYALVLLRSTVVLSAAAAGNGLDINGHVDGDLFMVPAHVVNRDAERRRRLDGSPGAGRNRYLPLDIANRYKVEC